MYSLRNSAHFELVTCLLIWIFAVLYSVYCFAANADNYFRKYLDEYSDFSSPGWDFISRKKDKSDFEWEGMKYIIKKLYLWVILSVIVSEILSKLKFRKILQLWRMLLTVAFIIMEMGAAPLIALLFQPLIFTIAFRWRSKALIWLCEVLALGAITKFKTYSATEEFLTVFRLTEVTVYMTLISIFWMNLKCLGYYLDFLQAPEQHRPINFLSYALYLPTLICGPFISYKDFTGGQQPRDFASRLGRLIFDILRFTFWLYFLEFCLHFIYVNAVMYNPKWVEGLDSWSLYGYGYTMGQFFHIKYVVVYGLSTCIARFENIVVPSLPICIGRVHLYSDMWKYFDAGLYKFLLTYIYIPSVKLTRSRVISSLLCFTFVYVWHGTDKVILIWAVLNYIGILIEYAAIWANKNYFEKSTLFQSFGPQKVRRIACVAATPILAMSAISNFFFFSRMEIGLTFASRFLSGHYSTVILLGFLYCCCQVSTELRNNRKTTSKHQQCEKLKL